MSLTLNMTAGEDNEAIFLIKVVLDDDTFYFSDTEDKITLSGTDFDGKVILRNSINDIQDGIDVSQGGGSSIVGTMNFSLARYNSYTGISNFFNEFFPATSGEYLTNREVHLGIVWEGATTTGEITWLYKYYIENYSVAFNEINLNCLDYAELRNTTIPHYEVQKEFDNGISYFPNARPEVIGQTLNIIYGAYSNTNSTSTALDRTLKRVPVIPVDPAKMHVSVACHPCDDDSYGQYAAGQYSLDKYFSSVDQYMRVIRSSGTDGVNDNSGCQVIMLDSGSANLVGDIVLKLDAYSKESGISDVSNITDNDLTNYNEIDTSEWASLRVSGSENTNDFGYPGQLTANIAVYFYLASNDANIRNLKVGFTNNTLSTPAVDSTSGSVTGTTPALQLHQFGGSTTAKKDSSAQWTIEEICSLDYGVQNDDPHSGDKIRVYYGYINVSGITILDFGTNKIVF